MREVTDDYLKQVSSGARQFGFYVNVYGNGPEPETLWLGDIISADIERSISDSLQIGACMSDRLTLQTRATTLFNGRGKRIVVYYRCTAPITDWVCLGTFYVAECVTRDGVTAVTAYDMMSRLDKRINRSAGSKVEALTFPCTMQDMLEYICARLGVTTDFTCRDITVEKPPDGYTARELIGYIAASHGANARFSPSETLKILPYSKTSEVIEWGGCYSAGIAEEYTVKGLLFDTGGENTIYIDGTASEYDEGADGVVKAYNPFATVSAAEYAWSVLGGLSYSAVDIEMPARNILEPGDVFTLRSADGAEKTAVVMEQTLSVSCTGGFVETIACTAEGKPQNRDTSNRVSSVENAQSKPVSVAEILHTSGSDIWADTKGGLVLRDENGTMRVVIDAGLSSATNPPTPAVHILSNYGAGELLLGGGSAVRITGDEFTVKQGSTVRFSADSGASWFVDIRGSSIHIRHDGAGSFILNTDGLKADFAGGGSLAYDKDGFYVNGKKVLTE